jgi:hypothetical protein
MWLQHCSPTLIFFRGDYDDSLLPYHLCLNGLTDVIDNHLIACLGDVGFPRVHHTTADDARAIQGYSPSASCIDSVPCCDHPSHDAGLCGGCNMGGRDAAWPDSAPAPLSCSHIPNPGQCCREFLAGVTCKACLQVSHHAVNCDMLAMALCLECYMKGHLSNAARDTIESKWVNQWKERLDNPCRKPSQVMRTYLDDLDMTETALDAQFDWDCWDVGTDSEDLLE